MPALVRGAGSAGIMTAMAGGVVAAAIIFSLCLAEKGDREQEDEQEKLFHNG